MKKFARRWHKPTPGKKSQGIYLSNSEVECLIRGALGEKMVEDCSLHLGDEQYFLPTLEEVKEIIKASALDRRTWVEDRFDCDDFAWVLKAHFVEAAYKDGKRRAAHCFGVVWGIIEGEAHAVNWVVTADRTFRLVEPQTSLVWLPGENEKEIWMMIS